MLRRFNSLILAAVLIGSAGPASAACFSNDCPDVKAGWGCIKAGSWDFNSPSHLRLQSYICVTGGMGDLVGVVKIVESGDPNVRVRIDMANCSYAILRDYYRQRLSSGVFQVTLGPDEIGHYIIEAQLNDSEKYSFVSDYSDVGQATCDMASAVCLNCE